MRELANNQSWRWHAIGAKWFEQCREPLRIEGLCLTVSPTAQEFGALFAAIGPVHAENEAVTFDPNSLSERELDGEPVLAPEVKVSLAFLISSRRSSRTIAFRPRLLRYDPTGALADPLLDLG
jgi:hypothetical protein